MRIERRYTKAGQSPYADIAFRLTASEIRNPDGSVVFHADNVEVPKDWSQVAADVLAQKYFRKAGVPARLKKVEEETVPSWLWRSVPDEAALAALPEKERRLLQLYYFEDRPLEEVGKMLGLSKSWSSRLHARAVELLKQELAKTGANPDRAPERHKPRARR